MKTVLLLLLLCPAVVWAQVVKITPQDMQRNQSFLLMRDGSVVRGKIIRQDSSLITVQKRNGDRTFIEADQLLSVLPIRPRSDSLELPHSNAYSTGLYSIFVMKDGSRVEGKYIRRDSTMITVRKRNGQLTYFEPELLDRIDSVYLGTGIDPSRTFANRFSPWLLTGQTAYNPEKGRLYYRNTFLLLNEFDYGITRNWSIGASVNPFFNTIEDKNNARQTTLGPTIRFFSKLTFPIGEQFRFGVDVTYQPNQKGSFYRISSQLRLQGLATFGTSERNATLGYGMQIHPESNSSNTVSYIMVGVMHKLSRNLTFLSDNTFYLNPYYSGTSAYLSVALRLNRRRHAFDLGVLGLTQPHYYYYSVNGLYANPKTEFYFTPYIGYSLLIGTK